MLVAGASGRLGRHLVRALAVQGYRVRALTRRPELPTELEPLVEDHVVHDVRTSLTLIQAMREVSALVSTVGASVRPALGHGRLSYGRVDLEANTRLLNDARRAGVPRFAYVSLYGGRELLDTEYAWAHERVVDAVLDSGMSPLIVRPTGFFGSLEPVLGMARRGVALVLGDGSARTNPVHEADVAGATARALAEGYELLRIGGPDVLTRREIAGLALEAWGRSRAVTVSVPDRWLRRIGSVIRPLHPRLGGLLGFAAALAETDVVAPSWSERSLEDHFARRVAELRGTTVEAPG